MARAAAGSFRRPPRKRVPRAPSRSPRGAAARPGRRRSPLLSLLLLSAGSPLSAAPAVEASRGAAKFSFFFFPPRSPRPPRPGRGDAACPCGAGGGGTPRPPCAWRKDTALEINLAFSQPAPPLPPPPLSPPLPHAAMQRAPGGGSARLAAPMAAPCRQRRDLLGWGGGG